MLGAPRRFSLVPDDYHAEYVGTAADGRRFFVTTPFEPGGSEYVATFFWKANGAFDTIKVDDFGPRDQLDTEARRAAVAKHLSELGQYVIEEISVAPFTAKAFGTKFGFVPQKFEGEVSVNLTPGDYMAFYEPWDSGEYDT